MTSREEIILEKIAAGERAEVIDPQAAIMYYLSAIAHSLLPEDD